MRAMGKYEKLGDHLGSSNNEEIKLTFREIENILGFRLPKSAFKHRSWWANDDSHVQALDGWIRVGYNTKSASLDDSVVTFVKVKKNL